MHHWQKTSAISEHSTSAQLEEHTIFGPQAPQTRARSFDLRGCCFGSDQSPIIIGCPCLSLTDDSTDVTLACEQPVADVDAGKCANRTTVWCRFGSWSLIIKLNCCTDENFKVVHSSGEILKLKSVHYFAADVWLMLWSWILVKMKFDQDLCMDLWYDLKKLLW